MKIFGICGSPRAGGNSGWALLRLLSACEKNGCQTAHVLLSDVPLRLCDGSLPEELGPETMDDGMADIKANMLAADLIVFSSPTYFDNITPQLMNLLARTDPFYEELKGKAALILVVGQAHDDQSRLTAASALQTYCAIADMPVLGTEIFRAKDKEDLKATEAATQKLDALAKKIAEGKERKS